VYKCEEVIQQGGCKGRKGHRNEGLQVGKEVMKSRKEYKKVSRGEQ